MMTDASKYTSVEHYMKPFNSIHVVEVAAGTVIKDERTGEEIVIDDENSAMKGNMMWVTKKTMEQLQAEFPNGRDA